ncbi:MAG: M3 family oligoendopeptidase [Aeromonas sp.]|jgi:oligoendopeptidase F|uniref:Peptidase M3 n=1 Tax=Aeromonas media TaxID=651 RepID=A0A6M4YRR8_AERME|nr:M3 family oligoendopeptidase [Aeromonas media]MBP8189571.1 M3 family oligoendopeptidase [Aeromonas sp.]AHX60373.1 oligoendopeptidase F [Aeromonas media WS]QHQ51730.1 peptidase M3 [Aeromonas media]QJT28069.1 peptidase M3 [Aeromonas media]QQQ15159.1 M3 family oligoendopeptidase [Aeromonas media]
MQQRVYPQQWQNQHIYPSLDSCVLEADMSLARASLAELSGFIEGLAGVQGNQPARQDFLREVRLRARRIREIGWNIAVLAACTGSQDARDPLAKQLASRARALNADLFKTLAPIEDLMLGLPEAEFEQLMQDPLLGEEEYRLRHERRLQDQRLPVEAEQLVIGLGTDGLHAWGNLYNDLVGKIRLVIDGREMGLAEASNLLSSPDRALRKEAFDAISAGWEGEQETVAAILNALNGWRLELSRQRGKVRTLDALDLSCHQSHIERVTLDTLMQETWQARGLGQRALGLMARRLGIEELGPEDLFAPPPASSHRSIPFEEAIEIIALAFTGFDPEMGEFARMMAERGWIDAAPTPNRRTGAYCTKFADPVEPRVFITYAGTMDNVITLAHELGHAWHNWLIRDLPMSQRSYPMTLAETASIFAETLVRSALFEQARSAEERQAIAWAEADGAATFLVNIPARFDFEQALVAEREQGYVSSARLKALTDEAWGRWYEKSLSRYHPMFWAAKAHFSIAGFGFYNYPYLFGYLFSLGVYQQLISRQAAGEQDVAQAYRALLRDTGRMSAEELVMKHLGQDIREAAFWQGSLALVAAAVDRFEQTLS